MPMNKIQKVLLTAQGFIIAAFGMISPIYAVFVEQIGGGILAASGAVAAYSIATGVMVYIISKWEDHVKHLEKMMTIGYILSAIGFFGYIFVQNIYELIIVQILLGLSVAVRAPAFDAVYSKHLDHHHGVLQWGYWETMAYIVTALAALIGGYVANNYGFRMLFVVMFISSLIALLYSLKQKGKYSKMSPTQKK